MSRNEHPDSDKDPIKDREARDKLAVEVLLAVVCQSTDEGIEHYDDKVCFFRVLKRVYGLGNSRNYARDTVRHDRGRVFFPRLTP